ncbi:protein phosphatase-7 [Tritrichomonas foetus]|uniref:Protein phosphatase-7 n=1 Tax=Tritrichomonas foetus TaxID=1144522 RepID=A0A1J4JRE5_9EUKA|nr:protein phosphatase-7 [Tritrichomonas foetus]|eukprot:OHT01681.1 protein phosphatase-7 [Tritrichomonas foetus]
MIKSAFPRTRCHTGTHIYIVFNWLPLAGVVGEYFCVHGGIAPSLQNIAKIDKIVRPLDLNKNSMVYNMLWSDPTDASKSFLESGRGSIQQYGQIAVEEFLAANNLKGMIRGHQYISNGIKREFNKTVFTVFSASSYKHPKGNKCGLLTVTEKSELKFTIYDSFPRFKREDALFYTHNENRIPTFVETSLARATTDQTTKNIPSTFADLKYGKNIKTGIFHKRMVPQRIRLTRFSASSRVKPIIPIHPIG